MTDPLNAEKSALNEVERKRHQAAIERLTEQCGIPQTEVGKRYEAELEKILVSTRIRDFLPILVARKVRQELREHEAVT